MTNEELVTVVRTKIKFFIFGYEDNIRQWLEIEPKLTLMVKEIIEMVQKEETK